MENNPIIWHPQEEHFKSRVGQFSRQHDIDPENWRHLVDRSIENIEWFWHSFLSFAQLQWSTPYEKVFDRQEGLPWTEWFIGGKTNIAYNCLDWHTQTEVSNAAKFGRVPVGKRHSALIWENEAGQNRTLSYGELDQLSGKIASLLKQLGLSQGDTAGIYMPMVPEVLAILFACFKLGIVAVPVFSGFGAEALAKRMLDAEAKIIFTADGGRRRGKLLEIKEDVDEIRLSVPSLKHVVVLKYTNNKVSWLTDDQPCTLDKKCNHSQPVDLWLDEAIENLSPAKTVYDLPAEHPCLYLYTSGTTGKPKGTVHTHAGAMAQISKELGLVFDVQPSDKFFWLTDIGWMMGPWEMIGVLYWGGTLVMYDGSPDYPQPDRIWQLISRYQITTLGISPTVIRMLKAKGEHLLAKHDLTSLNILGSTGEPWDYDSYMWFFNYIGHKHCPIMNISGGTELIGCLLTPLLTMPLPACSLGSRGLAMDVDVYDESGKGLLNSIGHLVLKQPAPSLTKGFLGDRQRYIDTYFKRFPNVWYHGDWARRDKDDYWYLYGRSDDTIKIAGKRIGPGEVESALIEYPDVCEAAAIGVPDQLKGESLVCFLVIKDSTQASTDLQRSIIQHLVDKLGSIVRPKELYFVEALPKTRSGKIVRGLIKKTYLNEHIDDLSSIDNPESLKILPHL